MIPADRKAFVEIVVGFAELKGKQLSAPALELYWRAMQDWPLAEFRDAAAQLVKRCEFMPTPKDFEDLRRAGAKTTGEAWLLARQAWRSGAVTCGDERIDRVVAMLGGYALLGQTRTDQLQFIERRFAEHYESLTDAEEVRATLPALTAGVLRRLERSR